MPTAIAPSSAASSAGSHRAGEAGGRWAMVEASKEREAEEARLRGSATRTAKSESSARASSHSCCSRRYRKASLPHSRSTLDSGIAATANHQWYIVRKRRGLGAVTRSEGGAASGECARSA